MCLCLTHWRLGTAVNRSAITTIKWCISWFMFYLHTALSYYTCVPCRASSRHLRTWSRESKTKSLFGYLKGLVKELFKSKYNLTYSGIYKVKYVGCNLNNYELNKAWVMIILSLNYVVVSYIFSINQLHLSLSAVVYRALLSCALCLHKLPADTRYLWSTFTPTSSKSRLT